MVHEWSYNNSSIKHQPQQTKGLRALKILYQLSCPMELKKFISTLPAMNFIAPCSQQWQLLLCMKSFPLPAVWALSMQQIPFTTNSFQIYFHWKFTFLCWHQMSVPWPYYTYIYTYIILNLNLLPVLFMDSRIVSLKLLSLLYKYSNCHCIHYL